MTEGSKMTCPVCDSEVPEEKDECPVCGANLVPFKENFEGDIDESSMEKVIDLISDEDEELFEDLDIDDDLNLDEEEDTEEEALDGGEEKELIDDIKDLGLTEEEDEPEKEEREIITFECPVCNSEVSEDASECPNCGVVFEEESGEEEVEEILQEGTLEIDEDFEDWEDEINLEVEEDFEDVEEEEVIGEDVSVDLKSRIDSFYEDVEELKGYNLDVEEIEADINELEKVHEQGKEGKWSELIDQIEEEIDHAKEIARRVKRCEHYIEWLSGRTDISELEEWIDDVHKGCEIGEFRIARKKANDTEEDIEEVAESLGLKEGEKLEEEIQEKRRKIKDEVSNIDEIDIDLGTSPIEEYIDEGEEKKDRGELKDGFHKVMEAKKDVEELYRFTEMIVEGKSKVESLKQQGGDYQKFSKKIEEAKEEAREGNFTRANEMTEKTVDKIEKALEEIEEEKKIEEEEKETLGVEEKKDLFKKIQEKIPQMRSLLGTAKDFEVEIEEGKALINKAVKDTKQNEYVKANETLDDCRDFFQKKLEKKIDIEIKKIKEKSTEDVQSIIDEINKYREEGAYEKVSELIDKGKEKTSEEKESMGPVKQKISEVKNMVDKGKDIGLKFPKAVHLLERAKKRCEDGEAGKAQEMIDKAQDKAFQRLESVLKKEIKEARDELKQAKIQGANISKPVELLKETNNAQKKGDLEESLDKFKEFKDEMERIREKL